jgi:hypothetical protein
MRREREAPAPPAAGDELATLRDEVRRLAADVAALKDQVQRLVAARGHEHS